MWLRAVLGLQWWGGRVQMEEGRVGKGAWRWVGGAALCSLRGLWWEDEESIAIDVREEKL